MPVWKHSAKEIFMSLYYYKFAKHFVILLFVTILLSSFKSSEEISLAGKWRFKIDRDDIGIKEKWFNNSLDEEVRLPGSMAENGKGDDITLKTQWTGSIYDSSY